MSLSSLISRLRRSSQKNTFNAVIEGAEAHDEWSTLAHKLVAIDVPEGTGIVRDSTYYIYLLYGNTIDFNSIQTTRISPDPAVAQVPDLRFCDEVFRNYSVVMERPRAIFMIDGRVFVDSDMIKDKAYTETLPGQLPTVEEYFNDPKYAEMFRKSVR